MIGENIRSFTFKIRYKSTFERQRPEEIKETILGKSESQVVKVSISVEYVCDCTAACLVGFQEKHVFFWLTGVWRGTVDRKKKQQEISILNYGKNVKDKLSWSLFPFRRKGFFFCCIK